MFKMEANNVETWHKCKICKQYITDTTVVKENRINFLTEKEALEYAQFCVSLDHADEIDDKAVPSAKLTSFVIFDKYNHICPFDTGFLEKGIDLFFSGYIKTIDAEDPSTDSGILVLNAGPIKEWWVYGFDGGKKSLIGISTGRALYYLMAPSKEYEHFFQNAEQKIELSKRLIEFLIDFGYQDPTFEDLMHHLKNFDIPQLEELIFQEAGFLCSQIVSYDEEIKGEAPMISFRCIQTLINLTGITINKEVSHNTTKSSWKKRVLTPKPVTTKLVKQVFEKCFSVQQYTNNASNNDIDCNSNNINKLKRKFNKLYDSGTDFPDSLTKLNEQIKYTKPTKHKECSKIVVNEIEWLRKNSFQYNGRQGYSSAFVGYFIIEQGDYVMLHADDQNKPLRVAKICYMYESVMEGPVFHAHFFCRGIDTILGNTADPRELFVVDDCDDYPIGCIVKKAEVNFVKPQENWADLGNVSKFYRVQEDNGINFYFSKIYDYEFSRFRDYVEDVKIDYDNPCFSCRWQKKVKSHETPIFKEGCVLWRDNVYKIGTTVFLEPGQSKSASDSMAQESPCDINDRLYPELYRKTLDKNKDLDIPTPFTIGLVEDIKKQNNDIKIRIRMFYRPEDIKQTHNNILPFSSDINYLFWSNHVIWTPFKNVAGMCYVSYLEDENQAQKWSENGPFRFYYTHAYDYKTHEIYHVPVNGKKIFFDLDKNGRYTRSNFKHSFGIIPPTWPHINKPLRCMDIYAGCGGLSEGLHQSGVAETFWAIEKESAPAQAYQLNNPQCRVFIDDCNSVLESVLKCEGDKSGYPKKGDVELLVGGPPCQGYSGMNRFSSQQDSYCNNSQIMTFLSYCDYYRPRYFIFENVRNFVTFKKTSIFKLTLKCLLAMGYQVAFGIVQAGNFGLPQTRRRFILLGVAPGYELPNFPEPLHVFSKSATFLSVLVDGLRYDTGSYWSESLPYQMISVNDAIGDLPRIENGASEVEIPYKFKAQSHFQKSMRKNNTTGMVKDHICKEMSELVEARMKQIPAYVGADWRDLPNRGVQLKSGSFTKVLKYPYRKKNQKNHELPKGVCKCVLGKPCDPMDRQINTLIPWFLVHTADRHNHWASVYGRLEWKGCFGTTITNPEPSGTQGRVLHPEQNRVVSIRECARSQGFPDHYKFFGNILDKHRQIGNAVPPLVALAFGREIIKVCNKMYK